MNEDRDPSAGFVLINGNTWQPKVLYMARKKQRKIEARKAKNDIIWMRNKPSVQIG